MKDFSRANELLDEIKKDTEKIALLRAEINETDKARAAKQAEFDRLVVTCAPTEVVSAKKSKKSNPQKKQAQDIIKAISSQKDGAALAAQIMAILGK